MINVSDKTTLPIVLKVNPHVMGILGICKERAYGLTHRADFPAIRVGKSIRVPRDAFFRWLDQQVTTEGERYGQE